MKKMGSEIFEGTGAVRCQRKNDDLELGFQNQLSEINTNLL